jgi:hypothetical protein
MDFLVHHEFGSHTKITVLQEKDVQSLLNLDKDSIDYWLEIWYLFYNQAFTIFKKKSDFHFICYEDFVSNPKKTLETLLSKLNLSKELVNLIKIKEFKPMTTQNIEINDSKYLNLYNNLKLIAINIYG